jgi:hypothetical protein
MACVIGFLVSAGVAGFVAYSMTQSYTYKAWQSVDLTVMCVGRQAGGRAVRGL